MKILVTGGAGFIGSHLVDALIGQGHDVTVFDSLEKQVHPTGEWPEYLHPKAERIGVAGCDIGVAHSFDFRDVQRRYDVVFHLAAVVGVGQSQYEIERYVTSNTGHTSAMLQFWTRCPEYRPGRLIVASSMSIYGEGDRHHGISETACPELPNVYAQTKYDQERYCLLFGNAYNVPTCALRFFNVYGERQSLSNPYTGVAAMFAARLLHGKGGLIFEDGRQTRDFVNVADIVQGLRLAMTAPDEVIAGEAFNIGTGKATSLLELHQMLALWLGVDDLKPIVTGEKRKGDIRHCFASVEKARRLLGYDPKVELCDGIRHYTQWLQTQDISQVYERVEAAAAELKAKGLLS